MNPVRSKSLRKSDRFLRALRDHPRVLVVAHDNPDPDAIASTWAVKHLIDETLDLPTRCLAGGAVVRAENRLMLELLAPPLELVNEVELDPDEAIVVVDCQPTSVNHLLGTQVGHVVAVIDHHRGSVAKKRYAHRDVRPKVGATSTIVTQYLREQAVLPDPSLATALIYGIQTDVVSGEAGLSASDKRAITWLVPKSDLRQLAQITNAPLSPTYYEDLFIAIENTFTYGDVGFCMLPHAHWPEVVGEVADLLIRCETLDRVLCAAVIKGELFMSVRTTATGGDAAELVRVTLDGIGHGGGHRHRSGGKIAKPIPTQIAADVRAAIRDRWLAACGIQSHRGSRLVSRREILKHL